MKRCGIIAGGNWIVDKVKFIDRYPRCDELARISDVAFAGGGGARNVLADISRLGADFPLYGAGLLGEDADADFIFSECKTLGIDTSMLRRVRGGRTPYTDVMCEKSGGRRTFFYDSGVGKQFNFSDFDLSQNSAKILYCGYIGLLESMDTPKPLGYSHADFFARASNMGFLCAADFASSGGALAVYSKGVFKHLDFVSMNEIEAGVLSGGPIASEKGSVSFERLKSAADALFDAGLKKFALIHFRDGAWGFSADGKSYWVGAVNVPKNKIVCANGCGDALFAGFLMGMHDDVPYPEAMKWGAASAATCIGGASASNGILPLAKSLAFAEKYGYSSQPV